MPFFKEVVRKARKDPGCIAYELFKNADANAPDQYGFIEIWRSEKDYQAHRFSAYMRNVSALIRAGKVGLDTSKGDDGINVIRYTSLQHSFSDL